MIDHGPVAGSHESEKKTPLPQLDTGRELIVALRTPSLHEA